MAAVHGFCQFRGIPKVQPAENTQTMTHARSTISLVVRVISRSKNNFYDAWFRGKNNIGLGGQRPKVDAQTMDRLGVKVGGESRVKSRNKFLIKSNKFALNEKANGS